MPRFNPLTIPLLPDWRKTTLAQLRVLLGIKAGSAADKALKNILRDFKIEQAVKHILAATMPAVTDKRLFLSLTKAYPDLPFTKFWRALSQAFSDCLSARFAADLPPEVASGIGRNFQQGADLVRSAAEHFTLSGFAEKFAIYRRGEKTILKRMSNDDIINALAIAEEWAWTLSPDKGKALRGRPANHAQASLIKLLRGNFKKILGKPVNSAVAVLVNATFQREKPLTERDVRERSSRRKS